LISWWSRRPSNLSYLVVDIKRNERCSIVYAVDQVLICKSLIACRTTFHYFKNYLRSEVSYDNKKQPAYEDHHAKRTRYDAHNREGLPTISIRCALNLRKRNKTKHQCGDTRDWSQAKHSHKQTENPKNH